MIQKIVLVLEQKPQSIAIEGESLSILNKELLQRAKEFAKGISDLEIFDTWIGVDTSIGWEAYAAILACWMTGNGYVPINFNFPQSRIKHIIKHIVQTYN